MSHYQVKSNNIYFIFNVRMKNKERKSKFINNQKNFNKKKKIFLKETVHEKAYAIDSPRVTKNKIL